jgi:hypothetical protein
MYFVIMSSKCQHLQLHASLQSSEKPKETFIEMLFGFVQSFIVACNLAEHVL